MPYQPHLSQCYRAFRRDNECPTTHRRYKNDRRGHGYWVDKKARKTYLKMVQSVQLTGSIPKMAQIGNPIIGFSEEDARRLHHPHDDALVISIRVGDYNTHRVMVDNGSSTDILYYPAFQQMRIDSEQLVSTNTLLFGFGGTRVFPLGASTLSVTVNDYP